MKRNFTVRRGEAFLILYCPGSRQTTPKLRAFIDHLESRSGTGNKPRASRRPA
jgi:hypothetical protein